MNTTERSKPKHAVGRPPMPPEQKKQPIALKLAPWLIEWLDKQGVSRAKLIEDAMAAQYKIKHD